MRTPRNSLLVVFALGVGCGGTGVSNRTSTVTQTVGAMGAEIQITSAANPEIAGTTLLIPAGALTTDTVISVLTGNPIAHTGETAVGPSVRFLPDGLQFAQKATLTLPYKATMLASGSAPAVDWVSTSASGQFAGGALHVDASGGTVSVDISHFTDFQVVGEPPAGGPCHSNADCGAGQVCISGACANNSGPDGGVDGGGTDGGGGRDGGTDGGIDGGFDGGPITDGGGIPDSGPITDGGSIPDAGTTSDGGTIHDGGGASDGGVGAACTTNTDCLPGHSCISGICH